MPANLKNLFTKLKIAGARLAKSHGLLVILEPAMNKPAPFADTIDLSPQPLKGVEEKLGGGNQESAALRALVGQINTLPMQIGSEADPRKRVMIPSEVQADIDNTLRRGGNPGDGASLVQGAPAGAIPSAMPAPAAFASAPADFTKVMFTGRIFAGKDYCADAAKYTKIGMADPIYQIASELTGLEISASKNKDAPGIRAMLQAIGQYGRGTVNDKYPWTLARANFLELIHSKFLEFSMLGFGDDGFWIKVFFDTLERVESGTRVACTNIRFKDEFDALKERGFQHWHVMTSKPEWDARVAANKIASNAPQLSDTSEQFAIGIDNGFIARMKQPGGKMRCIWNSSAPVPSPRVYTVAEFVARVSNPAPTTAAQATEDVFTGD